MVITHSFKHEEVLGLKFGYQPFGKPKLSVYLYFVDGLLIDTGQTRAQKQILAETRELPIDQIFITHHHEDHSGNIKSIQAIHDCGVYASFACCEMMKALPTLSFVQQIIWGNRPAVHDLIAEDELIETENFSFQIIPITGHASDMVALYEPHRKWLFSADLYINSRIDYMLREESIAQQIESTKNILKLDFNELYCSHKPQLQDGKKHLTQKLNFLESFFHDVAVEHEKGHTAGEVFKILKLKENWFVKTMSGGSLCKMNMVKSVIRDLDNKSIP